MIAIDASYGWLGIRWGVSSVAAFRWVRGHATPDQNRALPRGGGSRSNAKRVLDRLELVSALRARGWTDARIAHALWIAPSALHHFLKRHAPDSVEQAIVDLTPEPLEDAA
ncbi:MAG: hypothetical protein AAGH38_00490 [Pseudomonadota bacterium]